MKTKSYEIEAALRYLLESCDEIAIEAHLTKVKITKQSNWGVIGYSVGVIEEGRCDYEYQFTNSLFEIAEKIESGDF